MISLCLQKESSKQDIYNLSYDKKKTQYLSFQIGIFYTWQNLKLKVSLGSIFPKDFMDIKFVKFGQTELKLWFLEVVCPK